jgi:hypothetical protein
MLTKGCILFSLISSILRPVYCGGVTSVMNLWKHGDVIGAGILALKNLKLLEEEEVKSPQDALLLRPWQKKLRDIEKTTLLAFVALSLATFDPRASAHHMLTAAKHPAADSFTLFLATELDHFFQKSFSVKPTPYEQDMVTTSFEQMERWREVPRSNRVQMFPNSSALFDAMIPCANRDTASLGLVVSLLRKNAIGLGTIWIVSSSSSAVEQLEGRYDVGDIAWVPESTYPLNKDILGADVFQQLLKLLFTHVVPAARDTVLVCDADVLWLRPVEFVRDSVLLYSIRPFSHVPWDVRNRVNNGWGYPDFVEAMLGFGKFDKSRTSISHHMVFHRKSLELLFEFVSTRFQTESTTSWTHLSSLPSCPEAWVTFVEVLHTHSFPRPSEYELFHSFVFGNEVARLDMVRVAERPLAWEDFGECCLDKEGNVQQNPAHDGNNSEWCNMTLMVEELSEHFDFIACHRHLRPQQ